MQVQIRERADTSAARVDEQQGLIAGVKLLGRISQNDRTYSREAMARAVPLYNGVPIYLGHRVGQESREKDKIGWVVNPRLGRDGNSIFGDVRLLTKHPMVPALLQAARLNPALFGMSHDALGEADDSGKNIHTIASVESCDVVDQPATTRGFFESLSRRGTMGKKRTREDAMSADAMDVDATPGASGGDGDALATVVDTLQKLIGAAGSRHDQDYVEDLREALSLIEPWVDGGDDGDEPADTSSQESRASYNDGASFVKVLQERARRATEKERRQSQKRRR